MQQDDTNKSGKKFLSTSEAARMLRVSRITVFNRIKKGEIKAEQVGRNYVIPIETIQLAFHGAVDEDAKKKILRRFRVAL